MEKNKRNKRNPTIKSEMISKENMLSVVFPVPKNYPKSLARGREYILLCNEG